MGRKGVELMAEQTKLSILQASPSASQESGSRVSLVAERVITIKSKDFQHAKPHAHVPSKWAQ